MADPGFESVLLGSTGFVGSSLARQASFSSALHRPTIGAVDGRSCGTVVCAAAPGAKWLANSEPDRDRADIAALTDHLRSITAELFILISTVDVYPLPIDVDELSIIERGSLHPYGKHRLELEDFVAESFENPVIIRLPGLYGRGLRKNFIFDMLTKRHSEFTHHESRFQFYDMERLWADVSRIVGAGPQLMNIATEPLSASRIASEAFGQTFRNDHVERVSYDMKTRHAGLFDRSGPYIASGAEVIDGIRAFIHQSRSSSK